MSTINRVAHGLVADQRVIFSAVSPASQIDEDTVWWVLAAGLTANAFQISETQAGTPATWALPITSANMQVVPETTDTDPGVTSYAAITSPTDVMAPPTTLSTPSNPTLGSTITAGTVRLNITLTPVSDIRVTGVEVQITNKYSGATPQWDGALILQVTPSSTAVSIPALGSVKYGVRLRAQDVYGNYSAYTSVIEHTTLAGPDSASATLTALATSLINGPATVTIDSTGITIESGALIIKDEFGTTVLVASGFAGSWSDFLGTGLYNGNFAAGATGALTMGRNSTLPYWTTSNPLGTAGLSRVADGSAGAGFKIRNTNLATSNNCKLISDKVRVAPGEGLQFRAAGKFFVESGGGGRHTSANVILKAEDKAGSAVSLTGASLTQLNTLGGSSGSFDLYAGVPMPDNVYQAWVEVSTEAQGVTSTLDVFQVSMLHIPLTLLPAGTYNIANLNLTGVVTPLGGLSAPGIDVGVVSGRIDGLGSGFRGIGGTTFPGSPSTDDVQYRSDLGMWFFYDGTRWLSTQLFHLPLPHDQAITADLSATTSNAHRGAIGPLGGCSDIWLVSTTVAFNVNSGGTALSNSHKWVGVMTDRPGSNTISTTTINSGSSAVMRQDVQTIGALLGTQYALTFAWTKTGTPGGLGAWPVLSYRMVAT